ncbi:MAG: acyl-CoA dehydrogenase family protein [Pseudomonadota bacterium]
MSELGRMLQDLIHRLFGEACTSAVRTAVERGEWCERLWHRSEEAGLTLAAVPELLDGAGAPLAEAAFALRSLGYHAVPIPLAETIVGNWLLGVAGIAPPKGPLSIVSGQSGPIRMVDTGSTRTLSGTAGNVPWGRAVHHVVAVVQAEEGKQAVVLIPTADVLIEEGTNLAGEPRDEVVFHGTAVAASQARFLPDGVAAEDLLLRLGAYCRCQQMAGAMEWILERCVGYAAERRQFGRPIGGFQAVQQMMAVLAGQVGAAVAAAGAALAAPQEKSSGVSIGFAKSRIGAAAGEVAALAHQLHGAMGYTYEYPLNFRTRRLLAWRDEFGSERFWQIRAGQAIAQRGASLLWHDLTV